MNRPATVVAVLVVVLLHALLLVGRAVASLLSLAAFALTHPDVRSDLVLLLSSASGTLVSLVLAAGDVVLVVWLWRRALWARVVLTVLLVVSGLLVLVGVVALFVATSGLRAPVPIALSSVQLLLCVAGVVLLWLPATSAWLRGASVRPAGPGL